VREWDCPAKDVSADVLGLACRGSISSLFDETTEAFHPSHPRLERRTSQRLERRESSARSVLLEVELGEEAMSSMSSGGSIIEEDVQMEEEEQGGR
jgi:hypothetical protein